MTEFKKVTAQYGEYVEPTEAPFIEATYNVNEVSDVSSNNIEYIDFDKYHSFDELPQKGTEYVSLEDAPLTIGVSNNANYTEHKVGDTICQFVNNNNGRYQGGTTFVDRDGNKYIAIVESYNWEDEIDPQIILYKEVNGNYQKVSSVKTGNTHGNSLSVDYDPITNEVSIYMTKYFKTSDLTEGQWRELNGFIKPIWNPVDLARYGLESLDDKSYDSSKIGMYSMNLDGGKLQHIYDVDVGHTASSISVDAENHRYATTNGNNLYISELSFSNKQKKYVLQDKGEVCKDENILNQSGCLHNNIFYKVISSDEGNYVLEYDLGKADAKGYIPCSRVYDMNKIGEKAGDKSYEVEDISFDNKNGLVAFINTKDSKGNKKTEVIKIKYSTQELQEGFV